MVLTLGSKWRSVTLKATSYLLTSWNSTSRALVKTDDRTIIETILKVNIDLFIQANLVGKLRRTDIFVFYSGIICICDVLTMVSTSSVSIYIHIHSIYVSIPNTFHFQIKLYLKPLGSSRKPLKTICTIPDVR